MARTEQPPLVMVGFNRRFAAMCEQLRKVFGHDIPRCAIPGTHWLQLGIIVWGATIQQSLELPISWQELCVVTLASPYSCVLSARRSGVYIA